MIDQCPHCRKELLLNAGQVARIESALAKLPPGKLLKLSCPACKQPIELRADGTLAHDPGPASAGRQAPARPKPSKEPPPPPPPPDLSWIVDNRIEEKEVIEDVPMAMVLMEEGPARIRVAETMTEAGYLPVFPGTSEAAIEQMQFVNFGAVVLHSAFEKGGLEASAFHAHMGKMAMGRRRYIFYVLVGPEFHTLYDLEALSASANLVVNDKEIDRFGLIYKKAFQDYQALFDPLVEALAVVGKR